MIVLGIETSSAVCSVGVVRDGAVLAERSLTETHIHSEQLQRMMLDVIGQAGMRGEDVKAVAVSIGPGSFTGLRIGLSSAKGWCFAHGIPLVGVPSFDGARASARERTQAAAICVCVDAKQGEWYAGCGNGGGAVRVVPANELTAVLRSADVIVTDKPELLASFAAKARIELLTDHMRGGQVALLGAQRLGQPGSRPDDLATLEPMYLKDFVVKPISKQE